MPHKIRVSGGSSLRSHFWETIVLHLGFATTMAISGIYYPALGKESTRTSKGNPRKWFIHVGIVHGVLLESRGLWGFDQPNVQLTWIHRRKWRFQHPTGGAHGFAMQWWGCVRDVASKRLGIFTRQIIYTSHICNFRWLCQNVQHEPRGYIYAAQFAYCRTNLEARPAPLLTEYWYHLSSYNNTICDFFWWQYTLGSWW